MNSKVYSILVIFFLSAATFFSQNTNVTVYNNDLGVIKETRFVDVQSGKSVIKIADVPSRIDPTSVHIKFPGTVLEQNYKYDLANMNTILDKYSGKQINIVTDKGEKISGKLLSVNGNSLVLRKKKGGLLMLPDFSKYTLSVNKLPEGLITKPTLEYLVESKSSGKKQIELSFSTAGMNWHGEYVAVLNDSDTKINLNSWVSITNQSGADYKNAKLKLVAGDINRAQENKPMPMYMTAKSYDSESRPQIEERAFFEYHIYDLPELTTLRNNEQKQIAFISGENITAHKQFAYTCYLFNEEKKENAEVNITFENSKKNNLGIPLPAGKIRLFKKDKNSLELIGEDYIKHTPKDEKISLKVGKAFDVLVSMTNTKRERISKRVTELTREIKIDNHKDKKIEVAINQIMQGDWKIISSNFDYKKKSSKSAEFIIPVKADKSEILKFTVRVKRD